MLFRKKNIIYKESPLDYWEEKSFMLIVPKESDKDFISGLFKRISEIENVEVLNEKPLSEKESGSIKIKYQNDIYEIGFYISSFSLPETYLNKSHYFNEQELLSLKKANTALTIFMKFNDNPQKSYHLQLKVAIAMIPDTIGVMDESQEKILHPKWVKMASESVILPSSSDLYNIQVVYNKKGTVWLHTHGLCRCGLHELEILNSDKNNFKNHYNLLSTYANYLIDSDNKNNSAYIGVLSNKQPVVVTSISWTLGIKEYKKLELGNIKDRQIGHNSKTNIIFLYKNKQDEKENKLSKITDYNNLWGDNPVFFISNEETKRMKDLAMERFYIVKEQYEKNNHDIIIKIGLPIDNGEEDDYEHIWFKLIEFKEDKFKAKLLQEPYNVSNMHKDDEEWYTIKDVTDWIIYTKDFTITPKNAYILLDE